MKLSLAKLRLDISTKRMLHRSLYTLIILGAIGLCWLSLSLYLTRSWNFQLPSGHHHTRITQRWHPIQQLMDQANKQHDALLANRTVNLHPAVQAYRRARGCDPPPGFAKWFYFAQEHDAVITEGLFDQIYHDLEPFWNVPAKEMRDFARDFENRVSIRGGVASMVTSHTGKAEESMQVWLELVQSVARNLTDLDVAMDPLGVGRVLASGDVVDCAVRTGIKHGVGNTRYSNSTFDDALSDDTSQRHAHQRSSWKMTRLGCMSGLLACYTLPTTNTSRSSAGLPNHSFHGYVQNWTLAKEVCHQPSLDPVINLVDISTTPQPVPIFSGSKLSTSNSILIPSTEDIAHSPSKDGAHFLKPPGRAWDDKTSGVVWRGPARGAQAYRFVATMNATALREAEIDPDAANLGHNPALASYPLYNNTATDFRDLATWLGCMADVGFTDLSCNTAADESKCIDTNLFFRVVPSMPFKEQLTYKFLPVIDNDISPRFLAVLASSSVPILATVQHSWYDSRLTPWLHFIPMDKSFTDVYGLLDYFLGNGKAVRGEDGTMVNEGAHDEAARRIAMEGKEWAGKVVRRADMQIYMLRLLLEYARLCDRRETETSEVYG